MGNKSRSLFVKSPVKLIAFDLQPGYTHFSDKVCFLLHGFCHKKTFATFSNVNRLSRPL